MGGEIVSAQKTGALCTEEERLAPSPPPPPQAGGAEAAARAVLQACPTRRGCVWGWLTTERAARAGGIAKSARHRPAHGQPHAYAPCTAEAVPYQSPPPPPPPPPPPHPTPPQYPFSAKGGARAFFLALPPFLGGAAAAPPRRRSTRWRVDSARGEANKERVSQRQSGGRGTGLQQAGGCAWRGCVAHPSGCCSQTACGRPRAACPRR